MAFDLIIRGGTAVRPGGLSRVDIGVEDGRIAALEPDIEHGAGPRTRELDARGLTLFPGVVDAHVHFNDPGRTHWEGVGSGSAALAAGGGTCFIDMPLNSSPPTLDGPSFDAKLEACRAASRTDFALYGGLTPGNLDRLEELAERGVVGFKAFMCPSGIEDFAWSDDLTLYRGMETAARRGLPVLVHAESAAITSALTEAARRSGRRDVRAFLDTRPVLAELEAISRALLYAEETGCRVHVVHVSSARGVELVRRAADSGRVDASCETCPHYLVMNEGDMERIGARAKCAPPLRAESERSALLLRLLSGEIDTVGSDHSPAPAEIKEREDFFDAWGGIAGVQSTLRLLLTLSIPAERIASVACENPARRFRLAGKGGIAEGRDADLVLVDTEASAPLERGELCDRNRLSPYVGRRLRGEIRAVFLRGEEITDRTRGRLITPS